MKMYRRFVLCYSYREMLRQTSIHVLPLTGKQERHVGYVSSIAIYSPCGPRNPCATPATPPPPSLGQRTWIPPLPLPAIMRRSS